MNEIHWFRIVQKKEANLFVQTGNNLSTSSHMHEKIFVADN